jgi:hypothetical protein
VKIFINKQHDTIIIVIVVITGPYYMPIRHYRHCAYDIFRAYEGMIRRKIKIKK